MPKFLDTNKKEEFGASKIMFGECLQHRNAPNNMYYHQKVGLLPKNLKMRRWKRIFELSLLGHENDFVLLSSPHHHSSHKEDDVFKDGGSLKLMREGVGEGFFSQTHSSSLSWVLHVKKDGKGKERMCWGGGLNWLWRVRRA